MNKKRGFITLEELVKFIPSILVILIVFTVFFALSNNQLQAAEKTPAEEKDFENIIRWIKALEPGEVLKYPVPIQSDGTLSVTVYPAKTAPTKCAGQPCICWKNQKREIIDCETIKLKTCKDRTIGCSEALCVAQEETSTKLLTKTDQVVLCRQCSGELRIGTTSKPFDSKTCPI